MTVETPATTVSGGAPWHDTSRSIAERVESLVEAMTIEEKVAQLYGIWVGASDEGGDVAPFPRALNLLGDARTLLESGKCAQRFCDS